MDNVIKVPFEIVQMIESRRAALDYLWIAELIEMGNLTNEQIVYYLRGMAKRATDDHDKIQKMYRERNSGESDEIQET